MTNADDEARQGPSAGGPGPTHPGQPFPGQASFPPPSQAGQPPYGPGGFPPPGPGAPPFGSPQPGYGPMPPQRQRSTGKGCLIALAIAFLLFILIAGILNVIKDETTPPSSQSSSDSSSPSGSAGTPGDPAVGDCTDSTTTDVDVVDCGSSKALFTVVGVHPASEGIKACLDDAGAEFAYENTTTGKLFCTTRVDSDTSVAANNAKVGDCVFPPEGNKQTTRARCGDPGAREVVGVIDDLTAPPGDDACAAAGAPQAVTIVSLGLKGADGAPDALRALCLG